MRTMIVAASVALMLAAVPAAEAGFVLLDNFESYGLGQLDPQSGDWTADIDSEAVVAQDPSGAPNQAFRYGPAASDNDVFYNDGVNEIADGTTGTLFFRAQMTGTPHNAIGMSPVSSPSAWGDYKSILRYGVNDTTVYARDGGDYESLTSQIQLDEWYNYWMVLDNDSYTYDIYVQRPGDPNFDTRTQLTSGSDPLNFRPDATDGDLVSIFFRTGGDPDNMYFDDIYLDPSGANLANPIPEPCTLLIWSLLAGLGIGVGWRRRKR